MNELSRISSRKLLSISKDNSEGNPAKALGGIQEFAGDIEEELLQKTEEELPLKLSEKKLLIN